MVIRRMKKRTMTKRTSSSTTMTKNPKRLLLPLQLFLLLCLPRNEEVALSEALGPVEDGEGDEEEGGEALHEPVRGFPSQLNSSNMPLDASPSVIPGTTTSTDGLGTITIPANSSIPAPGVSPPKKRGGGPKAAGQRAPRKRAPKYGLSYVLS